MKVSEALDHMTKSFLHRIIDSFTRDLPKPEEERARKIILRNVEELTDRGRIATVLGFEGPYSDRILSRYILEALINRPDHMATEEEIIEEVSALEREVLEAAEDPECLRYESPKAVEVLREVLSVALEDQQISDEELNLLRRLRQKLGIKNRSRELILAQLGHFPRQGNRLHTPSDFRDAFLDLQRRGVLFYCNKLDGGLFVVPDEVVPGVKAALGIDLSRKGWWKLLGSLNNEHLSTILEAAGLPKSGNKAELQERIVDAALDPSKSLDSLHSEDLYEVLKRLPGAKVSGTKAERVQRLLDYFDQLVVKDVPDEAPPGERYYEYLVELARRDRESLLTNEVIKKDREIEGAFEEGTRYLFRHKLGLELLPLEGTDHCDGCIEIGRKGDVLMWDNKSKESVYTFPQSHLKQFKRYIRDSDRRVACFLVIVPEIGPDAPQAAARLKVESGSDTDVALITAEDLRWVAETWLANERDRPFDPEVFNITAELDRQTLEQRMELFL